MEKIKGNPEFSERIIRKPIPWDPGPDILQFLDKNKLREVIKLQMTYRIKEMKMHLEFMEKMENFI